MLFEGTLCRNACLRYASLSALFLAAEFASFFCFAGTCLEHSKDQEKSAAWNVKHGESVPSPAQDSNAQMCLGSPEKRNQEMPSLGGGCLRVPGFDRRSAACTVWVAGAPGGGFHSGLQSSSGGHFFFPSPKSPPQPVSDLHLCGPNWVGARKNLGHPESSASLHHGKPVFPNRPFNKWLLLSLPDVAYLFNLLPF